MAFPLINPSHQFFDSSGSPLASGTLEFRNPTTNALINSYPTADNADAQTNENANPLTLDARGGFTGLYLEDGVKYKIILKDSAGATVDTQDDVLCPTAVDKIFKVGDIRRYGAVDDDATDNSAAFQTAAATGLIIIPETSSKWVVSSSVTLDNACTIISSGRRSTVRQASWGVPVFEIRANDISCPGHLYLETTESRTTFDAAALTASNNSATVKSEQTVDAKNAGSAIYNWAKFDNVYFNHLEIFGFITGCLIQAGDNWSINQLTVDTVDFGFFGKPGIGCQIGRIAAANIKRSQGVDPHALYLPGSVTAPGYGFTCDAVTCSSVEDGAHIISLKYQKNFYIGSVVGHTDVSLVAAFLASEGVLGGYDVVATKLPTNSAVGSGLSFSTSSIVSVGPGRYHSEQDAAVTTTAAVGCTTSSIIRMIAPDIKLLDADPPHGFRSSASLYIDNPRVEFGTDPTLGTGNSHAFNTDQATGFIEVNYPRIIGTQNVLLGSNSGVYEMTLVPDAIEDGLADLSITTNSGDYNTRFVGDNAAIITLDVNEVAPNVRSGTLFKTGNTLATTIDSFDFGSRGQRITVLINDADTTIDFSASSLKGNVGADWSPAIGDYLFATYDEANNVWACTIVDATA